MDDVTAILARSADEPQWIVNDNGELGVIVSGRAFFLYKGESLEYEEGTHDDGGDILWRPVGKREFGETCEPASGYRDERGYIKDEHLPRYLAGDGWMEMHRLGYPKAGSDQGPTG